MSKKHSQVFNLNVDKLEVDYDEAISQAGEVIAAGIILIMFAPFVLLAIFTIL